MLGCYISNKVEDIQEITIKLNSTKQHSFTKKKHISMIVMALNFNILYVQRAKQTIKISTFIYVLS